MPARSRARCTPPAHAGLHLERLLWRLGHDFVAGVDEVGMGPLAGPVVAAAVVFAPGSRPSELADSKVLPAAERRRLAGVIARRALAIGVGEVAPAEIDRVNVRQAGLRAMRRALARLGDRHPSFVLVDGHEIPGLRAPQAAYPKGDAFVASFAAASIVAKVHRDALMVMLARRYPVYGFERLMGYPTPAHLQALRTYGPCPVHRRSFAPVGEAEARQLGFPALAAGSYTGRLP
jgi:ribonuclease HII